MITGPLRDRFGLVARLDYYDADELQQIVDACRGHPRRRDRRRRRLGDRQALAGHAAHRQSSACGGCAISPRCATEGSVTADIAREGLALFGVDDLGLDKVDRAILAAMCQQFNGGPVGLSTVAISVGEQPDTVEDVYEPFLIQQGMIARTPRGRVAMPAAYRHLGLDVPAHRPGQPGLFDR